ncbi:MAG: hypothetical protein AB8B55_20005 [Mariniblastus sp.]
MTWFDTLTGFPETSGDDVRENLILEGTQLISRANNRTLKAGEFSTPLLSELRKSINIPSTNQRAVRVNELVGDVQSLHQSSANEHAVFQVASQFNCLEMVGPSVTPERGVGIYENDLTQGPACSICCGAGTIFRNYFAEVNNRIGQTAGNQVDCLAEIGSHFGNAGKKLWAMRNGYCLPSVEGLAKVENHLASCDETALDRIREKLKVGVQSKTEVTVGASNHCLTQVFCSALPVAYSPIAPSKWNHFPRLILDATYEATFYIALKNFNETGCNKLYLTLVGGGVFGNKVDWILSSIGRSLDLFANTELDVAIVSYRSSKRDVANFVSRRNGR